MDTLFTPGRIGTLTLPNRLVRSATAERMADADGRPRPQLGALYEELARGGVGLIITGHMVVHPSGKAYPEMTGIYADELRHFQENNHPKGYGGTGSIRTNHFSKPGRR